MKVITHEMYCMLFPEVKQMALLLEKAGVVKIERIETLKEEDGLDNPVW